MAETIYTPDGKIHVLVGSITLESIIREYAGDDAANAVQDLLERGDACESEQNN